MFGPFGPFGMRFDIEEFAVGLVAGVLLSFIFSRLLPIGSWLFELLRDLFQRASETFTRGAQDRYGVEMIERAETMHAAQRILTLSEIVIPPRILSPVPPTDPGDSDRPGGDSLAVLPNLPDATFLSGVYGGPSIPLTDSVRGGRHMMLTGPLGAGKTTALAYLALKATEGSLRTDAGKPLLPILIHAADFDVGRYENREPIDGLIAAVQMRSSANLGSRVPGYLRQHLREQRGLILVDGLDEFPEDEIRPYAEWLIRLREEHPGNQIIVAGPTLGYDGLPRAGLSPVTMAPWTEFFQRQFLTRWGAAWQEHVEPHLNRNTLEEIDPALITGWLTGSVRGHTPLEVTLAAWAAHSGDVLGGSVLDGYRAYLRRFLSPEEEQSAAAAGVAWIEGRRGTFDEGALRRGTPVQDLVEAGILIQRPNRQLSFFVPAFGAYLAGQGMVDLGVPETVDEGSWTPAESAHAFYVGLGQASEEAEHYLQATDDPLQEGVLRVGRWLRLAPPDAKWRPVALRSLGKIIQNAKLPYGLRLRATHLMAQSNESTAAVFFRRLLSSEHPSSRILGALGLGGLRNQDAVAELQNRINEDRDTRVRQAACLGLAGIGTQGALEALGETLLGGEEAVRVAAAEALAIQPDEGHEMLKEAATIDDLLTRRAAVFGLARIPEEWSRETLETLQVDDSQWVVRGAAAEALERHQSPQYQVTPPPQEVSELPWLVSFAAREGLGVAPGRAALEMVRRALHQGTPDEQVAAVETIGWVDAGELDMELRQTLEGGETYLRDAAFEALWRQRAGEPIELPEVEATE